jgi:hypothetical protein
MEIISGNSSLSAGLVFRLMPSGWFYQNMLTISQVHQDFLLPAVDEQKHRVYTDLIQAEERVAENLRERPYTIFAKLLLPALGRATQKSARMQSYLDAARVACAVERYRQTTGNLPETLEALCPRFLQSVPNDIIDGKPLRYHPESNGDYSLYCVGWNQTDDGGQLAWTGDKKKATVDAAHGDWVWLMTHR